LAAWKAAEQAASDAVAVRERADRAAELARERARADAEREARIVRERDAEAELARARAELDDARGAEELALRREVARRVRPPWLVVIAAIVVATIAPFAWYFVDQSQRADAAARAQREAEAARAEAEAVLARMNAQIHDLERQSAAFDPQIERAEQRLRDAQAAADRDAAERAAIAQADARAKARRDHEQWLQDQQRKQRLNGVHLGTCAGTALGCMDAGGSRR
ncbi:MAG TPA: hypothetical protein VLX92_04855, partial [Kofleriaceae bacterium]|nr:hypothetical protein [Kofleriaceae bacterium]